MTLDRQKLRHMWKQTNKEDYRIDNIVYISRQYYDECEPYRATLHVGTNEKEFRTLEEAQTWCEDQIIAFDNEYMKWREHVKTK